MASCVYISINCKIKRREEERFLAPYGDITSFQEADKYGILYTKNILHQMYITKSYILYTDV